LNDSDPGMRILAQEEYDSLRGVLSDYLTTVFPQLVLPPSTTAHLSAIVEIRTGVGGTESSLFLADLLRMYRRLANTKNWKSDIISCNDNEAGGIKAAILEVQGSGSYDTMRWESGVHRVQRVPATETSGRTHTSTVAVVVRLSFLLIRFTSHNANPQVLPSQENTKASQKSDDLDLEDVRVEVMRSRGAGGQVG
jgi:peptide chain release factor 1